MYPLLRVQVSLADAPGDAEREAGCVSRGWEREPADTDTGEMGQELQERFPESAPQGLMGLGAEPWCPGPAPTCAEREEHQQERSPGHGAHRTLVPTVGWAAPGRLFSLSLCQRRGCHANEGPPRARPVPP